MFLEKKWVAISAQAFVLNSTSDGVIEVSDASLFKVKQIVLIKSNTVDPIQLQIKRVSSPTTIEVGRPEYRLEDRIDVSAYTVADGAIVYANEQSRNNIPPDDVWRAVFAEEPVVALRSFLVDQVGQNINRSNPLPELISFIRNGTAIQVNEDTVDPANNVPLPVKMTGIQGDVNIEADNLNLSVQVEGEYNVVSNPSPDSVGLVSHARSNPTNKTHQTQRITAKRGTTNTDTVSQDVSLHDHSGNEFTDANPLKVSDLATRTVIQDEFDQTQTKLDDIKTEIDSSQYTTNEALDKATAIAGQYDDAASTDATEDNVASVRITQKRALHSNLRDSQGNEITNTSSGNKRRLDTNNDGVYDGTNNVDPSNTGVVLQTRNATAADSRQVERQTAIRGNTDTNTVSADVSLHDHSGNQFTPANPIPVKNNPSPSIDVIYKIAKMLNGASQVMAVNGSVTPQNFQFTPAASETWYLEEIHLSLQDSGSNNFDEFGNLNAPLTNGLLLTIQSKGVSQAYANLQDNGDISAACDWIWSPPSGSAFLNDINSIIAIIKFVVPIKIQNSTSDFVRWTVRDDLTGINFLRSTVKLRREN